MKKKNRGARDLLTANAKRCGWVNMFFLALRFRRIGLKNMSLDRLPNELLLVCLNFDVIQFLTTFFVSFKTVLVLTRATR